MCLQNQQFFSAIDNLALFNFNLFVFVYFMIFIVHFCL